MTKKIFQKKIFRKFTQALELSRKIVERFLDQE